MAVNEVVVVPPPLLQTPPLFPKTSLYVGDLDPRVTTADLFRVFSAAGKVTAARLCIDAVTGVSLRYGYVNFETAPDAAKALSSLNHTALKGKAMRIMWCQRNPVTRKTGVANLFVKNLDPSIDSAHLEAIFNKFGTVLSCKVAEENGKSKGFGFVQFEKEDSAMAALNAMHDTVLVGKKLYVAQFLRKSHRMAAKELKFTNLYVKNIDEALTEGSLLKKFSEFGTVHNAAIMRDREGKSKGFGFVSFHSPEEAKKAAEALNGALLGSKNLFVGRAQKKVERKELTEKARAANVYVKNLNPAVDDVMLARHFSCCGQVVSKKVIRNESGASKGFGFVSFSSPAEARKAVQALCGSTLLGRKIYVDIAQSKEDRQRALQELFRPAAARQQVTPSTPWFTLHPPPVNGVSRSSTSRSKLQVASSSSPPFASFAESTPQMQKNLTEGELVRLLTSPNGLAELVVKLLRAKGGKFTTGDYGSTTPLPAIRSR
ncbi:hypothetical protein Dimus_027649 [Dionaea muscipula]